MTEIEIRDLILKYKDYGILLGYEPLDALLAARKQLNLRRREPSKFRHRWRRRAWLKGCQGKFRISSMEGAIEIARRHQDKNAQYYLCKFCGYYHIGHLHLQWDIIEDIEDQLFPI